MSFRGGNRGGGWRGGRGGSREAHKPPPAKKVRTEVRTHDYIHVFTNPKFSRKRLSFWDSGFFDQNVSNICIL